MRSPACPTPWPAAGSHRAAPRSGPFRTAVLAALTAAAPILGMGMPPWPRAAAAQPEAPRWIDASASHLPAGMVVGRSSMASELVDLDGDGDRDVVLAVEFGTNAVLRNEGGGRMVDATPLALRLAAHDSEDVAVADFDGDGALDLVFVAEDDRVDEYYLGDGQGGFEPAPWPIPTDDVSNAVLPIDLDGDGDLDLVVGNAGPNAALRNDGGRFVDATADHLPGGAHVTQDLAAGDVDRDGDLDLVEGNEDGNRILLGDGAGGFAIATDPARRYPARPGGEETRSVELGDVDGDGDLDLVVANVVWAGLPGGNRLLLNDGHGRFADAPAGRLPQEPSNSIDAQPADLDGDGDLDLVVANAFAGPNAWRLLLGDGEGAFADATARLLPRPLAGNGIDADAADLDGDGRPDLYLANHGSRDVLLLSGLAEPTAAATAGSTGTATGTPGATATASAWPATATAAAAATPAPDRWRAWVPFASAGAG